MVQGITLKDLQTKYYIVKCAGKGGIPRTDKTLFNNHNIKDYQEGECTGTFTNYTDFEVLNKVCELQYDSIEELYRETDTAFQ